MKFKKGHIVSEEVRKKISIANTGKKRTEEQNKKNNYWKGKKRLNHSKLMKENNPFKGKKHSINTKKKISNTIKKNFPNGRISPGYKGKKHSEETKRKMRISQFNYIKNFCNINFPRIGHNEKQILDNLEKELDCKIIRQYEVEGYFVDGYIEEINLIIEIDERPKNKEKDINREKVIKNKLNCRFIRINDFD